MSLSGKKALITGARRNIGRGIALALAQEGCDIGINDVERDADAEETLRLIRRTGLLRSWTLSYPTNLPNPTTCTK